MKNYSKQNKFSQVTVNFSQDDTVCYERQNLLGHSYETIPLVQFAPEAQVVHKKLSQKAKWLMRLELCILGFFYGLFFSGTQLNAIINFTDATIFFSVLGMYTLWYYYQETRVCLFFCDYNFQKVLISLPHDKNDIAQQDLIKDFDLAVRHARVSMDQRNMARLQKGIDAMLSQQIISQNFAETLRGRVGQLTGSII